MDEIRRLLEQFQGLSDRNKVFVFAAATAILGLVVFFVFRAIGDWFASFRKPAFRTDWADDAQTDPVLASTHGQLGDGTGLDPDQTAAWMLFATVVGAAVLFLVQPDWWMAILGGFLGVVLTFSTFIWLRGRYRWKIQEQLPDILYSLSRSARAGLSLERSLELLGKQNRFVLAGEFRRCSAQMDLGLPVVAALRGMAHKVQSLDFNSLVATVAMYQTSGGNLPLLLERLASSVRDHNQFRGYVRSATAMGRLAAFAIAVATPCILMGYLFFQPEHTETLFRTRQGLTIVGIALGLEVIGGFWLYRLLKIEM